MSTAALDEIVTARVTRVAKLTVDQYERMIETGILREGAPIELMDGMLVYKDRSELGGDPMTIGGKHNYVMWLLGELNLPLRAYGCHMQCQGSLRIPPPFCA